MGSHLTSDEADSVLSVLLLSLCAGMLTIAWLAAG